VIINKNSKFALVGHGFGLFHLFNEIVKKKLTRPIIITHEKKYHLRDLKQNKNDISIELDSIIMVIKSESKKKQSIDGYTIQLYLGDDRTVAEEIEERINEIDSLIYRRTIFTQPNYRVKVGSYYDRFLVNKEFKKFKEKFPDAIIIPEKIKFN